MKHPQHIVAVKSDLFKERVNGFSNYKITGNDLIIAQRASLEKDDCFRQVLPMQLFYCKGKVWAYRRAASGGESRLHGKVAVFVGGHWDLADIIHNNSVIDFSGSLSDSLMRELKEEVVISSNIVQSRFLDQVIVADDTDVDRKHVAMVWLNELDGFGLESNEAELDSLGFIDPKELLNGDYELETWARMACEILVKEGL